MTICSADIANFPALHAAYRKAVIGKRRKPGAAAFAAGLETQLLRLERELHDRTWRPGRYVEIAVRDPKPRWSPPRRSATASCTTRCAR